MHVGRTHEEALRKGRPGHDEFCHFLAPYGRFSSYRLPGGEKYALLASWDLVLGLDLERVAREGVEIPPDVQLLVDERDEARRGKDFARSDDIRDRLTEMGWEVMDTAEGTKIRPR